MAGFGIGAIILFFFALIIASLLIIIAVYDLRHKIIPDSIVYPFIVLALGSIIYRVVTISGFNLSTALLAGPLVALPFFALWYFSKGRLMGFGDVKLMLGIGWLTGLEIGYGVFLLSFWIGGIVGLFLLALTKRYGLKSQIPFGPFLILGLFVAVLWNVTIRTLFPLWP
jgi:leader peptidase (prepilin peptidase)/N-methyltransferase